MNDIEKSIRENLFKVQSRIDQALTRAGRAKDAVQLVAVTKYAAWEWVEVLVDLGITNLGESRPQQLSERAGLLDSSQEIQWHLIGHLQRNKVRGMLECKVQIHSIDSVKLLSRIDQFAQELHLTPEVFLEVNISGETAKDGFSREELISQSEAFLKFSHVRITGLMTMAPHTEDEQIQRNVFQGLRLLRDRLVSETQGALILPHLSMGMSGDFEVAIEEGATHIRIGSQLFMGLESRA